MSNTQEPLDTSALFGATGMLGGTIMEALLENAIQSSKPIIWVFLRSKTSRTLTSITHRCRSCDAIILRVDMSSWRSYVASMRLSVS